MTGGLILFVIVGWKPYNYFWGRNINLSGISPAKRSRSRPNSVYVDIPGGGNVQGILGAIGPFWAKWGLGRSSLAEPQFFGLVNHATFRQLRNGRFSPNLVTKRISVSRWRIRKDIFENFHFRGHFLPISDFEIRSNRHLTWSRIQVKGCICREIQFTPRCSPRAREFPRSVNFSLRRTVAELRGVKFAHFSDLAYFSYTKPLKRTLRWPAYSSGVTSQNDSNVFLWQSKVQRGAFRHRRFPAR